MQQELEAICLCARMCDGADTYAHVDAEDHRKCAGSDYAGGSESLRLDFCDLNFKLEK